MPTRRLRAAWPAYAIALLAAGIALVLRWGYGPVVPNHLPLLTMYAAVAFAAWYGGYGPGLLAATLGVVAAHFVGSEAGSARSTAGQLDMLPDLIVYAGGCLLLIGLGAGLRTALDRAADRQRLLEQEILERQRVEQKLREADRRKDEFLATLAHELRNPLHPIRTAAALLRDAAVTAPALHTAGEVIDRQVRQLSRLLDDLLDVARITQNNLALRSETLELGAIVDRALETARSLIEGRRHELTVSRPGVPVYVRGDGTRLEQVLFNLLDNAAKYTPDGGHLFLIVEAQDAYVNVTVRDGGIGIAPAFLPHVFEMFSRADNALERSSGGLGIGLALVRRLTELHGGTVEARSAGSGAGSEFIVRLPTVPAPSRQHAQDRTTQREPSVQHRVLVVDDNIDGADTMKAMLESIGNEVQVAYDGIVAIEAAASFLPQVVLLDIGLPKLNGYEVAQRIRKQSWGARAVLIAVSGWGQQEDKARASAAGFDHHLTKPVDLEELIDLLAAVRPANKLAS
jgi:signal transduction histidine kinase/ActR/RegA family two-component response regulator